MKYADKKNIKYVVVIGENEVSENKVTLKNMRTKECREMTLEASVEGKWK